MALFNESICMPFFSSVFFSILFFWFQSIISAFNFISELLCHHLPFPSYHIFSDNQAIHHTFLSIHLPAPSFAQPFAIFPSFLAYFLPCSLFFSLPLDNFPLVSRHLILPDFSLILSNQFNLRFSSLHSSLLFSTLLFSFFDFCIFQHSFLLLSRQSILSVHYNSIRFL